ncbi:tetratricopeptide repeat protein [Bradymonas sediminis]|uniref:Uncharacterized protein n=1 Tax=Bradymonas sediminis TaxID=1548548 RepID=A0A2Z4FLF8_9DELT|nr:tetratricopeptide repeat protein [Bradymonas sediminis]AWV89803.1 hypothetical protein DN745_10820 [Bradymonas sediminis]TDP76450.1 tetratricopeptide repeat protein [Bradymonas sediminis]
MMKLRLLESGKFRTKTRRFGAALSLATACVFLASPAFGAQNTQKSDATAQIVQAANASYNKGDYADAAEKYRAVIQADPEQAIAYRNLARSYFWQGIYPDAVAYYDFYLRLAPDADDRGQVQSERRLSASRAGEQIWRTPTSQAEARDALSEAIEDGHAYRAGAGGAWGIYQTLLRTGYAQPELAGLKRRLVRKLLNEYEGLLVPDANQPAPRMELDDWNLQLDRLAAARSLADDPAFLSVIDRRAPLAEAAIALLNGRFDQADSLSRAAIKANPDMPFIRWFQVRALIESTRYEDALSALDELEAHLRTSNPKLLDYSATLRASILQRVGRGEDSSDIYLDLLNRRASATRSGGSAQ